MIRQIDRGVSLQANVGYMTTPLFVGDQHTARFQAYVRSGNWSGGASGTEFEIMATNFEPSVDPNSWVPLNTPVILSGAGITTDIDCEGILYLCAKIISTASGETATVDAVMVATNNARSV